MNFFLKLSSILCIVIWDKCRRTDNFFDWVLNTTHDLEDKGQSQRSLNVTHPLMPVIICAKYGKNPSRTLWNGHDKMYHNSIFTAKSLLNELEDIGQQSLHATHPLTQVIICTKYGKNTNSTVEAVEQTWQDVPYFSSFIVKSWLNDLEDTGQSQRSLGVTYPSMLVIICA